MSELPELDKYLSNSGVDNAYTIRAKHASGSMYLTEAQATEIIRRCEDYNPWIPVNERLPKESGDYQVVRQINRFPTTREYCAKSLMWLSHDTITHWKPIVIPDQALADAGEKDG